MKTAAGILEMVGERRGAVLRSELLQAGYSDNAIDHALARGLLRARHWGVYVPGSARLTWEQELLAAIRATAPFGVVAGPSAAALLRFDGFSPGPLHLLVPANRKFSLEGVTVLRARHFDPETEHRVVSGLPVTRIPRTLLDLVPLCTDRQLIIAIEGLMRVHQPHMKEAVDYLRKRASGRARVTQVADWIFERLFKPPTDDQWEVVAELLVREAGLAPTRQRLLFDKHGNFIAKPDLVYRDHLLAVEVDGEKTHGTPGAKEEDRRREARLNAAGYEVLRTSPRELRDKPQLFIARLRAKLAERPCKGVPPMSANPEQLPLLSG